VIALPPILYSAGLVVAAILEWLAPFTLPVPTSVRWIAGALIAPCVAVMIAARMAFGRAGTNVNPMQPATTVVATGPFRFTRNPMYVAMTLASVLLALATRWAWLLVALVPVLALMHWGVVLREERYLARKFGAAYDEYRKRVRRYA
jgi:protein-S-isoprenylcysteine O-methyltransferase Ste14